MRLLTGSAVAAVFAVSVSYAQEQPQDAEVYSQVAIEERGPLAAALPELGSNVAGSFSGVIESQNEGELLATDLMGQVLYDAEDRELGEVVDVLFASSGILGIVFEEPGTSDDETLGTRRIAVPFEALAHSRDDQLYRLVLEDGGSAIEDAEEFVSLRERTILHDDQHLRDDAGQADGPVSSGDLTVEEESTPSDIDNSVPSDADDEDI